MAYLSAEISAADIALYEADRPILLGTNAMRPAFADGTTTHRWNQTGSFATADSSASMYGAAYGGDDGSHVLTKPDSAQAAWYYLMGFATGQSFDSLVIINHNLGSTSATVVLEIADDSAFTTNLVQLCTVTPSDDSRIVELELFHTGSVARLYSGVEYARLKITYAGTDTPQLGEVILSQRLQLSREPADPYDVRNLRGESVLVSSNSGVQTRYVWSKGRRHISARITEVESSGWYAVADFFRDDCDYGQHPLVWIDAPYTEPEKAAWMHWERAELIGPYDGHEARTFQFSLVEQGPHYQALE